jgi:hypothetical protein
MWLLWARNDTATQKLRMLAGLKRAVGKVSEPIINLGLPFGMFHLRGAHIVFLAT